MTTFGSPGENGIHASCSEHTSLRDHDADAYRMHTRFTHTRTPTRAHRHRTADRINIADSSPHCDCS